MEQPRWKPFARSASSDFDGDRWASRTSRSLLYHSPLASFVADDIEGYVDLAVGFATEHEKRSELAELRLGMRDALVSSSVCDSASLARALEAIYSEVAKAIR